MRKYIASTFLLFVLSFNLMASQAVGNKETLLSSLTILKNIIDSGMNEQQAMLELDRVAQAKRYFKDDKYIGHHIYDNNRLLGIIQVGYQDNKPIVGAYELVPLKVRVATKTYRFYRESLLEHYKETSHNQFDMGGGIVALLVKKKRELAIYVQQQGKN